MENAGPLRLVTNPPRPIEEVVGLLVGLNDAAGLCLGIGTIIATGNGYIDMLTSVSAETPISQIALGDVLLTSSGDTIPVNAHWADRVLAVLGKPIRPE